MTVVVRRLLRPTPTLRSGRSVRVTYVSTASAAVTLEVMRGTKVVARVAATLVPGRGRLTWNGKPKLRPGAYRLQLKAVAGDGQTATDGATLRVARG
ncbi:MAG TPA: hypothetical protein VGW10_14305 [Solirubrobacteraceae bacterium]|nr:hypothetical protein [Solirubrobacteraceae bacterium]